MEEIKSNNDTAAVASTLKRKAEDVVEGEPVAKQARVDVVNCYHHFVTFREGESPYLTASRFLIDSTHKSAFILAELGKLSGEALCQSIEVFSYGWAEKSKEWKQHFCGPNEEVLIPTSLRGLSMEERGTWDFADVDEMGATLHGPITFYHSVW